MKTHYLKVAIHNLIKYKTQSAICIVGLAVGFACFALSTFWVHYEMTYDSFHQDADRIYLVSTNDEIQAGKFGRYTPPALANYLESTYEEIEKAVYFKDFPIYTQLNHTLEEIETLEVDSAFMNLMGITILEGNDHFWVPNKNDNEVAITRSGAIHLFGTADYAIGRTIISQDDSKKEYRIGAIVSEWGEHSTMKYKALKAKTDKIDWVNSYCKTLIKISPQTDIEALKEKMNRNFPKELQSNQYTPNTGLTRFILTPITGIRHSSELYNGKEQVNYMELNVSLRYIIYFSVIGVLIIVCSLVNFLTLFIDRCRTRQRELALRKVNGASEISLHFLLLFETFITLTIALCLGMAFIELLRPLFSQYTGIAFEEISIYQECLLYVVGVVCVSLIIISIVIGFFRRQSLQNALQCYQGTPSERLFRKCNIVLQLFVCLSFIFCTTIIQKQLQHLRAQDVGFEYEGRAAALVFPVDNLSEWTEKIKALPMVTEIIEPKYWPLVGQSTQSTRQVNSWDGLGTTLDSPIFINEILSGKEYFEFYNMQLLAGEWVNQDTPAYHINLMESTARKMGWAPKEAIGKHIYHADKETAPLTVIGVVKDCAFNSPTADIPDVAFFNTYLQQWWWNACFVLFKYQPGTWERCRQLIENIQQDEYPNKKLFLYNEEEEFKKYLKAEDTLAHLLNFASIVCMLIAVFGIYSLITLTCEQRRKEIAIRKVNGAKVSDILNMFVKEYLLLLVIAALVAFPTGYAVMKQWLESYNRQTEIGILPFILIFCVIAIVIILNIGHRAWKAANENPAEVIKSE